MNGRASLHIMKTKYDTKVEYIEDNQDVSLPLSTWNVPLHSSMIVAMATALSTIFLFDLHSCFNYKLTS